MDSDCHNIIRAERIYLPANQVYHGDNDNAGVPIDDGINDYMSREFPMPTEGLTANYSIPHMFVPTGEAQASQAEKDTLTRLCGVVCPPNSNGPLWQACFQGTCYAGMVEKELDKKKSDSNKEENKDPQKKKSKNKKPKKNVNKTAEDPKENFDPEKKVSETKDCENKLKMKEHDFVVFNIFEGKYYITLIEVKSTCDDKDSGRIVSKPEAIKNNKRCGLHQLSDHENILKNSCNTEKEKIHSFLFWPYLTMWTKNPLGEKIKRWEAESGKHVFCDTISKQDAFNDWFYQNVLAGESVDKSQFDLLFKRFIVMSCGVFVNEIHQGLLALLTQEQLTLMYRRPLSDGSPTIVHGAAGTGKTLLILQKLKYLHERGMLNEKNRALYICFWTGIRADFCQKLDKLELSEFVDTERFFISGDEFMQRNHSKYRHIFMDECEAVCLAFTENIIDNTFNKIYNCRLTDYDEQYEINCKKTNNIEDVESSATNSASECQIEKCYGEIWFLVDINQVAVYLPKFSPRILKSPHIILSKVMRSTGIVYKIFSEFYRNPIENPSHLAPMYLKDIGLGHDISGPPAYWVNSDQLSTSKTNALCEYYSPTFDCLVKVIIDLVSTKGVKPNDLCAIPFIVSRMYLPKNINQAMSAYFDENGYRPLAIAHVQEFILNGQSNHFLFPYFLNVKGLEFKVVVLAVEDDDFNCDDLDLEDRRKVYIMASRCTCLLILVSSEKVKNAIDIHRLIEIYPFNASF